MFDSSKSFVYNYLSANHVPNWLSDWIPSINGTDRIFDYPIYDKYV